MPRADVGAAAAHVEQHVGAELLGHPAVALRRAAGCRPRRSAAAATGRTPAAGSHALLAAGHQEPGAGAHQRGAGLARRAATASAGRGAAGCRRSSRSTRPTSSAETSAFHIIQAVVENHSSRSPGPRSQLRRVVLQVLEQDPAVAVHDRLGLAGGAGGEQHAQRVGERHRLELELAGLGEQLVPADARRAARPARTARGRRGAASAARRGSAATSRAAVDVLVAVAVAGDGEQHRRLDLREPVDHAARRRTPARSSPRSRPGWRWRGTRPASPGCSAGTPTTRSPRPTPSRCSPARARATWSRSSPQVSSTAVAGLRVGDDRDRRRRPIGRGRRRARRSSAWRRGTTRAPGISRRPSTASYGVCAADVEVLPDRRPEPVEVGRPTSGAARRSRRSVRPRSRREPAEEAADLGVARTSAAGAQQLGRRRSRHHRCTFPARPVEERLHPLLRLVAAAARRAAISDSSR